MTQKFMPTQAQAACACDVPDTQLKVHEILLETHAGLQIKFCELDREDGAFFVRAHALNTPLLLINQMLYGDVLERARFVKESLTLADTCALGEVRL